MMAGQSNNGYRYKNRHSLDRANGAMLLFLGTYSPAELVLSLWGGGDARDSMRNENEVKPLKTNDPAK
jgi:hypothetical protein